MVVSGGVLSVESLLLLVELVLLTVTVFLLALHLREERSRQSLIKELGKTTRVLTRQEYFNELLNTLQETKRSVFGCVTGSRPVGDEVLLVDRIVRNLRDLKKNGVKIRYLVPKFTDRLYIGYLYTKNGAEVRYNNCTLVNDMRYMVVDDRFVLVGVPETMGEKEPTKKGYRIPSIGIAAIMREHYDRCWNGKITFTYEEYVKEVIEGLKKIESQFSFEPLARELSIPIEELERIDALPITPKPDLTILDLEHLHSHH